MSSTKQEKDRQKQIQEKCQNLLTQMLRDEDNKYCVDCDSKGPRWASWNLGVFLCIRCAGIHRNLGVHISKVKSVNLDSWTPEQVVSLQQMGNSRARAVYEANLPDNFRRPQTDSSLEAFVRSKYEQKKFIAVEWVPPPIPKVNWDKELDEEAERQRRRKKEAKREASGNVTLSAAKVTPDPLPLPKPNSSPKTPRVNQNTASPAPSASQDLLGLDTPLNTSTSANTSNSDEFTSFLSASPVPSLNDKSISIDLTKGGTESSRSAEEESFFNQPAPTTQEKRQMTKDSILALYATAPPTNTFGPFTQTPGIGPNMVPGVTVNFPINMQPPPNPMVQNGLFGAMPGQQNLASNPFFNMPQNTMPTIPVGIPAYPQINQSGSEDLMFNLTPDNLAKLPQQMARMNLATVAPSTGPQLNLQSAPGFPVQPQPQFFQPQSGNTLATNLWQ